MSSTTAAEPRRPLAGHTALVTGASRGIGMACARALHASGAALVLLARDVNAMADLAAELGGLPTVARHGVDFADPGAVARSLEQVRESLDAPPDIVVNAAAQFALRTADETAPDDFRRTLEVNVSAHFAVVQAFLPAMKQRGSGHIVTIGSQAERRALPGNAAYAASKFAARGLHGVLREELRGTGVRVTLVSPELVDTSIWEGVDPSGRFARPPAGRMLSAEAVADAVLFAVTRPADVDIDEIHLSRS